jgi:hypothetical protein
MSSAILHLVALGGTDVSGEHIDSIFKVIGLMLAARISPRRKWNKASCYGTSTVVSVRYRGATVNVPLIRELLHDSANTLRYGPQEKGVNKTKKNSVALTPRAKYTD